MKRIYIIATFLIIVLFGVLTNPDVNDHREEIKTRIMNAIKNNAAIAKPGNDFESAGEAFGLVLAGTFVEKLVENMVSRSNYLIFSTTRVEWKGETKTVGFGLFGQVYISEQLDHSIRELIEQKNNPMMSLPSIDDEEFEESDSDI
jgi:hypothetical protein